MHTVFCLAGRMALYGAVGLAGLHGQWERVVTYALVFALIDTWIEQKKIEEVSK